jgi:hypothetical protein
MAMMTVNKNQVRIPEIQIRKSLRKYVAQEHSANRDFVLLEEIGLYQHESRIDLIAVNGCIHGYEIKSSEDTLRRLPRQVDEYNRAFEKLTIVLTRRHKADARGLIPKWWGILEASEVGGQIELRPQREPRPNRSIDPYSMAQFLWRKEALRALEQLGLAKGLRSKPRHFLWKKLAECVPLVDLTQTVRIVVKSRGDSKSALQRRLCGGSSRPRAKSLHSQVPPVLMRIEQ